VSTVLKLLSCVALGALSSWASAEDLALVPEGGQMGALALHGDRLVLGNVKKPGLDPSVGVVEIWRREPSGGWVLKQELGTMSGVTSGVMFGAQVALDGDLLLIGEPTADTGGIDIGAAHAFRLSAGVWQLEQSFFAVPPLTTNLRFGRAVGVGGSRVIVSSERPGFDDAVIRVEIFRKLPGGWEFEQQLANPPPVELNDSYGNRVGVADPWAFVADVGHNRVVVYKRTGSVWSWDHTISGAAPPLLAGGFGTSMCVQGDLLAVGAPVSGGTSHGRVGLYRLVADTWQLEQALFGEDTGPVASGEQGFGSSVALDGGRLVVGRESSTVEVFEQCGGTWARSAVIELGGTIDMTVAADGGRVAVMSTQDSVTVLEDITLDGTFADLGGGIVGVTGMPQLALTGFPCAGESLELTLGNAAAMAPTALVLGLEAIALPFKGGVITVQPDLILDGLLTNAGGGVSLPAVWLAGFSGLDFGVQAFVIDGAAPQGIAGSNGVLGTIP
jgi:hypothetical protein